jgi:hypothetical protein
MRPRAGESVPLSRTFAQISFLAPAKFDGKIVLAERQNQHARRVRDPIHFVAELKH